MFRQAFAASEACTPTDAPWTLPFGFASESARGRPGSCRTSWLAASEIASEIDYSAYFTRRHEVISSDTASFVDAVELLVADVRDGFYPARGCEELNVIVERLMSNFARDARIEGVLTRFEIESQRGRAR